MPDILGIAAIAAKFALYLGSFGAVGITIVALLFRDDIALVWARLRGLAFGFAVLGLMATIIGYGLNGAALTGAVSGMIDGDMLELLWQTPVGEAFRLRLFGFLAVGIGLLLPHKGLWFALLGGLAVLWSFAQIGHIPEQTFTGLRVFLLLHLLGAAFWIGVLSPLRWLASDEDQLNSAAALAEKFGRIATLIVPILILAGGLMAWLIVGDFTALLGTAYGRMMLIKIAFIAVLLGLAALNKQLLVPALVEGNKVAAQHLAKSIKYEWLAVWIILLATATLTSVLSLPD